MDETTLLDYNVPYNVFLSCVITLVPSVYPRTKHIDVRYHFLCDHVDQGNIELVFVPTDAQLAVFFTKPLAMNGLSNLGINWASAHALITKSMLFNHLLLHFIFIILL